MMRKQKPRVVIIGGGFGGVRAALDLLKHAHRDVSVTLVDRNDFHSYTSDYYETATLRIPELLRHEQREWLRVRGTVAIPFTEIFGRYNKAIRLVEGEVVGIDLYDKRVHMADGLDISYDWLVFAPGSEVNDYGIPRLGELALSLKTVSDALNVRNALDELFLRLPKERVIRIVIGGGGFTGCEFAGELVGYCQHLARLHEHPPEHISITLVEGAGTLLGGAASWMRARARARLTTLGVEVRLNSFIERVEPGALYIKGAKAALACDVLVWTAGVRASRLVGKLEGDVVAERGCLMLDEQLRIPAHPSAYAIGDAAYCPDRADGEESLPMTAQVADSQGAFVASAIRKELAGRKPHPYEPKHSGFIIPLGGKYALANVYGIRLSGFLAWMLKRIVALRYFLNILPAGYALTHWWRGVQLYIRDS